MSILHSFIVPLIIALVGALPVNTGTSIPPTMAVNSTANLTSAAISTADTTAHIIASKIGKVPASFVTNTNSTVTEAHDPARPSGLEGKYIALIVIGSLIGTVILIFTCSFCSLLSARLLYRQEYGPEGQTKIDLEAHKQQQNNNNNNNGNETNGLVTAQAGGHPFMRLPEMAAEYVTAGNPLRDDDQPQSKASSFCNRLSFNICCVSASISSFCAVTIMLCGAICLRIFDVICCCGRPSQVDRK